MMAVLCVREGGEVGKKGGKRKGSVFWLQRVLAKNSFL